MTETAPIWICFIPQLVSVVGDCIGQRTARMYVTNSRRRFVLGLVMVSSIQMFVVLTIIQLAAPSTTTIIYETNSQPQLPAPAMNNVTTDNTSTSGGCGGGDEKHGEAYDWCSADRWPCHQNTSNNTTVMEGRLLRSSSSSSSLAYTAGDENGHPEGASTPAQDRYCFPQGPLSIYKSLYICPMLFFNGVVNIFYYMGEAVMYKQPLGVLWLVLAALTSSFFIAPVQEWFDMSGATQVNVWAVLTGLLGALLCLIERDPPKWKQQQLQDDHLGEGEDNESTSIRQGIAAAEEGGESAPLVIHPPSSRRRSSATETLASELPTDDGSTAINQEEKDNTKQPPVERTDVSSSSSPSSTASLFVKGKWRLQWALRVGISHLPLLGPFGVLSLAAVLYFVLMKYYNDTCRINMWGFNAYDQVMLPFYIYPVFLVIDLIKPIKRLIGEDGIDMEESLKDAFVGMFKDLFIDSKGMGFLHMFVYRFLINSRAMGYSYIAIVYNLSDSYLELTLIRVILSWMASAIVILLIPSFIQAEKKEREKITDRVNIVLKLIGTGAIVGSLVILKDAA